MSVSRRRRPVAARGVAAAALATLPLGLTACGASTADRPAGAAQVVTTTKASAYHGAVLDRPYAEPDLTFAGSDGRKHNLATQRLAPVTLVFFGYTHCPDECPTTLSTVAAALRRADPDVRRAVRLAFVTTDPARDTTTVMRDYLARYDRSFLGLRADAASTKQAALKLGVAVTGITKLAGGGYDVGHGAQVIGFDRAGKGRLVWMPDVAVGDLRADLTRLVRS